MIDICHMCPLNVKRMILGYHFFSRYTYILWLMQMQCPLLCKEFVIDKWQIYYARSKGADAILLIAAVLPDLNIKYFLRICKELGMTALIEVQYMLYL